MMNDHEMYNLFSAAQDYQRWTRTTAIYPGEAKHTYPAYALAEEAGEVMGVLAKAARRGVPVPVESLTKELGDVLWQVARLADEYGIPLGAVFQTNIEKLTSRQARNVLEGSGDDR
jgi:NTP pyrophosphatase (non-canonical NTP hydrolase)